MGEHNDLESRWALTLPGSARVGRALISRYGVAARRYHTVDHLAAVLAAVDVLAPEADDVTSVELAAWFHDAVYDVHADDNEEQSARLAEEMLDASGVHAARVVEVTRLVRLTQSHAPDAGDANGQVLCDADLAVLASPAQAYAAYVRAVREEYSHVSDADFRSGRAAVILQLLALPQLYGTRYAKRHWQSAARHNLEVELAALRDD